MRAAANLSRSQYGERQGADYSLISATSAHARRLIVALIVDSKKSRNLALHNSLPTTPSWIGSKRIVVTSLRRFSLLFGCHQAHVTIPLGLESKANKVSDAQLVLLGPHALIPNKSL